MHDSGFLHLDIKPANLMITYFTKTTIELKLIDFGLSRKMVNGYAFMDLECGTRPYKSPEAKDNSYVTPTADMYSLGVFLY